MPTSFFDSTISPTLFNPSFVAARNVINNNYGCELHQSDSSSALQVSGSTSDGPSCSLRKPQRPRMVDVGDIILRKQVSSTVLNVTTNPAQNPTKARVLKITNPFRSRVIRQQQGKAARVRRTVHIAEIMQFRDRLFTIVQFESEDPNEAEELGLAITGFWHDWMFNLQSGTFQFDLMSNRQIDREEARRTPLYHTPWFLPQHTGINPPLEPISILRHLQKYLPEYLLSISSLGETRRIDNFAEFTTLHPYLALGSVINVKRPGIRRCFPPPIYGTRAGWFCANMGTSVRYDRYQFYDSGRYRVDLILDENIGSFEVDLHFHARLLNSSQLRIAFLAQSAVLADDGSDWNDIGEILLLVNRLRFCS
ncbi:hypothetical protein V5O48_009287 [Marasmius crinis-equi]|uniref:Uncharacterized protein n=1 Tax=Marasmius crinis-equi TaxID=585013 RepID=A0ABR3FBJ3_9AGAR